MMALRFYTTTATKLFTRSAFGSRIMRSSSNVAAIESDAADKEETAKKQKYSLVAAAFENLQKDDSASAGTSSKVSATGANSSSNVVDERITNAKTVNGLLAVVEGNNTLTRKHALRIVSILAEWSTMNKAKLNEFENDSRFLKVCRMLGRTVGKNGNTTDNDNGGPKHISGFRTDDLNTVLGVAGDDEAAKLIASISLPQMVKVMSTLALRKRRSTPLLRSLAYNISSATEHLDLKQCADIFYAMATLNFQDSVLAAKVCADIQAGLPKNTDKSAVIGSILTSLGILKYRDLDILESLTQWTLKHSDICRPQDLTALFMTSAILNFKSSSIDEVRQKLVNTIVQQDFTKKVDWLNHIWALTMLGLCDDDNARLSSVLSQTFVDKLQSEYSGLSATTKMKLLNLNSYAQLKAKDYNGDLLATDSVVYSVPMAHPKGKQVIVNGLLDALKSLLPANNHVNSLVDSKMGFLIDAMCVFDAKRNPLPLDKDYKDAIKVALMVVDYHDICHGTHKSASGITTLMFDLLELEGYKVIVIPYNEFNTSDKLLKRVQYLESKFKELISSK